MSEHFENRKNEVALRRFAAVSFIEQKLREGFGVVEAIRLAALRPWPDENGRYSAARTLEDYWYAWKRGGFAALQPKSRCDEGAFRKLSAEVGQWLLSQVSQYPEIPLKVLYERWTQSAQRLPSLRTIYRFLRSKGFDAVSLRRGRLETGPTKAFEAPFVNDLWMTDFSPGPKLNIDGKILTTHLCLILDDHSRLIAYGAYYLRADSYAFHQTLKQAVQRRGIPYKLYTDQGAPFTNKHTQIICANLAIRLLHAKPYSAWSKGKIERCFYTVQQGFESTLKLPDNRAQSLEELNVKLSPWIQTVYHLRPHSSTGISPQLRFAQAAGSLRHLDAGLELEPLFFTRIDRTVRKNGTVRIEGRLYEVDLSLRALDRERLWYEFLRAGFGAQDLKRVVTYLQKEFGQMTGVLMNTLVRVSADLSGIGKTKCAPSSKPLVKQIAYEPFAQLNLGRLVQPDLRDIQDQEGAGNDTEDHELDKESMQVPTLQSIVKGLILGVEPDLTERRRGDDQDEGNAEQHNLGSLRRSYSKHHQHLGDKAPSGSQPRSGR